MRTYPAVLLCIALAGAVPAVGATTYEVGPTRTFTTLGQVAVLLNPGDLVLVDGGHTYPAVLFNRNGSQALPITIRGVRSNGARPVVSGGSNTMEVQGDWYVVEGFELTAGTSRCFYHHAHGIVLRDALVRDCPANGILGADNDSGSLTMEFVEVRTSGNGLFQHAVYMATDEIAHPGAVFRMQHCWIHDQNGGNAVKSRAERNEIYYNWIENSVYHLLELIGPDPAGGAAASLKREDSDVVGNVLVRANDFPMVRVGGDGTGESSGRYRFVNNTFVNTAVGTGSAVFRLFDSLESIEMHNNVFYTVPAGGMRIVRDVETEWVGGLRRISGQNNWLESDAVDLPTAAEWTASVVGTNPGFQDAAARDFRPAAGSPLVNAGTMNGTPPPGYPFPNPLVLPAFHPPLHTVQQASPAPPRAIEAAIDIGAYEREAGSPLLADGFEGG